ncbi:MAG: thioesterase family protein [Spirochaetaceae bacterium]
MRFPGIVVGDRITVGKTVSEEDAAGNFWTTDFEKLLSTPALAAYMIEASSKLLEHKLPDGFISVGKSSEIVHEHPSVVGAHVTVKVEIKAFDGYHIVLQMTANDESGIIARGTHVRSIVNQRWMTLKVSKRVASLK